jgi:crossover junction endodeoxyribonuclease RuvC
MVPVWYGTIKNPPSRPLSACLVHIQDEMTRLIETHQPHAVAIEGVFYAKNVKTMMILTHARGVIIAQCARVALPVYEYEPRRVKMAVVGYGAAQKEQVQKMVRTLLNLPEDPQNDAADALALAITHLHNRTRITAQASDPI